MTAILHYLNQTLHTTSSNGGMPTPELPPIVEFDGVGTMVFDNQINWLTYSDDPAFEFGANDFTIEFWVWTAIDQWNFPRLFSFGSYPTANLAISLEDTAYLWCNGNLISFEGPAFKTWTHIAVVRQGDVLYLYKNGQQAVAMSLDTSEFIPSYNLTIGNEDNTSPMTSFVGCISNFRIVTGTAIYTTNFTPHTTNLTAIPGTQLLLNAVSNDNILTDESTNGFYPNTQSNVTWRKSSPLLSA